MTTFFAVIAFVIWIGVIVGLAIFAAESGYDGYWLRCVLAGVGSIVLLAGGFTFVIEQSDSAMDRCLESGRAWKISGSHTELQYNPALKMATPTRVTDYVCVDVP